MINLFYLLTNEGEQLFIEELRLILIMKILFLYHEYECGCRGSALIRFCKLCFSEFLKK